MVLFYCYQNTSQCNGNHKSKIRLQIHAVWSSSTQAIRQEGQDGLVLFHFEGLE